MSEIKFGSDGNSIQRCCSVVQCAHVLFDWLWIRNGCVEYESLRVIRLGGFRCGTSGNRTSDTRIFSPLLYQLSYGTIVFGYVFRPNAMSCDIRAVFLSRCECKGKQKISTSKCFGEFFCFSSSQSFSGYHLMPVKCDGSGVM